MKFLILAVLLAVAYAGHNDGKWVRSYTTGPYYPQGRYLHASSSIGDRAVVFGGQRGDVYFNDLFSLSIQQTTILLLDDGSGPSARSGSCAEYLPAVYEYYQDSMGIIHQITIRNATFVIFGGQDGTTYYNDFWSFDLGGNAWTQMSYSGAPSARAFLSCAFSGDPGSEVLSLFGGTDGSNYFGSDSFYAFDVATGSWSTEPNNSPNGIGPSGRAYISGIDQGGDYYVFGGYDGANCLDETWVFSRNQSSWFHYVTKDAPNPNAGYAGVRMNGGGYDIFGGLDSCSTTTSDLEGLAHNNPDWTLLPANGIAPPARAGATATRHGKDLMVYGGADGTVDSNGFTATTVYDDLWYYVE